MLTKEEADQLIKKQNPFLVSLNKIDSKSDTLQVANSDDLVNKLKSYFSNVLLKQTNENNEHYFMAVLAPSFWRLNPCVVEVVVSGNAVRIVTYAKEGLIKQNTCQRTIDDIKKVVLGN